MSSEIFLTLMPVVVKAARFYFTFLITGSANVVTGETKSLFSLAKSVSKPALPYSRSGSNIIKELTDNMLTLFSSGGKWTKCPLSNCLMRIKPWLV